MVVEDRKEYSKLHYALMKVLGDCETDKQFLKRLLWAQALIGNAISTFSPEEVNEVSTR